MVRVSIAMFPVRKEYPFHQRGGWSRRISFLEDEKSDEGHAAGKTFIAETY